MFPDTCWGDVGIAAAQSAAVFDHAIFPALSTATKRCAPYATAVQSEAVSVGTARADHVTPDVDERKLLVDPAG
jgi:hypothetical protein